MPNFPNFDHFFSLQQYLSKFLAAHTDTFRLITRDVDPQYRQGFDVSALTAHRTLHFPDGDVYLAAGGMMPVFNARDYGVLTEAQGGTNMSALMQDFLETVRDAGGGFAYFEPGTYRGSSIVVYANTMVLGAGIGRTIFKRRDGTASQIFLMDERATDIRIAHMTLDGNRDNLASGSGINLYGNRRLHIHDVEIKEMTGYGIGAAFDEFQTPIQDCLFENLWLHDIGNLTPGSEWEGDGFDGKRCRTSTWRNIRVHNIANTGLDIRGEMCLIENVQAHDCGEELRVEDEVGGKGIGLTNVPGGDDELFDSMDPNPTAPLGYNILRDCVVYDCAGNGYNITQENFDTDDIGWAGEEIINRALVSNCIARNNGRVGFEWHATYDCDAFTQAENCIAEGNTEHGYAINIDQQVRTRYSFVNCLANANGGDGFRDDGGADAHGTRFVACTSTGNTGAGIRTATSETVIDACRIEGNTDDAVVLAAAALQAQVSGNTILDVPSGKVGVEVAAHRPHIVGNVFTGLGTGVTLASGVLRPRIVDNDLSQITTPVTDSGARGAYAHGNTGYKTESKGATSVADGGAITHELAAAPVQAGVTPTTASEFASITAMDADDLTVAIKTHDDSAGTTQTVYWWADMNDYSTVLWLPSDLPVALQLWLDPSRLSGSDTDPVTSWTDYSGNARHGIEATNPPSLQTAEQNGLNAVLFDGSNDTSLVSGFSATAQPILIAYVVQELGTTGRFVSSGNIFTNVSGSGANAVMNAGTNLTYTTALSGTNWHVHVCYFNGASSFGSVDGTRTTGDAGANASSTTLRIGSQTAGAGFVNAQFGDLIVAYGAIGDADIARLEGALAWKWGLEGNLVGGHAYENSPPIWS